MNHAMLEATKSPITMLTFFSNLGDKAIQRFIKQDTASASASSLKGKRTELCG